MRVNKAGACGAGGVEAEGDARREQRFHHFIKAKHALPHTNDYLLHTAAESDSPRGHENRERHRITVHVFGAFLVIMSKCRSTHSSWSSLLSRVTRLAHGLLLRPVRAMRRSSLRPCHPEPSLAACCCCHCHPEPSPGACCCCHCHPEPSPGACAAASVLREPAEAVQWTCLLLLNADEQAVS